MQQQPSDADWLSRGEKLLFGCLGLFGVVFVCVIIALIGSGLDSGEQSRGSSSAAYARLCCRDCQAEGVLIRLWEHPAYNPTGGLVSDRGEVVGRVGHNTLAIIEDRYWVSGENRYYYLVREENGQRGWVPETFVQRGHGECRW